jgi:hypothetical protein
VRDWRQERVARSTRSWRGYIEPGGISSWDVRLAEDPREPTARVALDVVGGDGAPDFNMAHNLRQRILGDEKLARAPTPEEWDFLVALRKERGYGKGG